MTVRGDERKRRRWLAAIAGGLLLLLAARLWWRTAPAELLNPRAPADAEFQYSRWVSLTDSDAGWSTVEVPPETGRAILELISGSERYVPEKEWHVRFGWPPLFSSPLPIETLGPWYRLEVLTADSESALQIDFVDETRLFASTGKYRVPAGHAGELRQILDALDEQCYARYEQQLNQESADTVLRNN
jgi:hypothetical protein